MKSNPRVYVTRPIIAGPLEPLRDMAEVIVNPEDRPPARQELLQAVAGTDAVLCHLTEAIDEQFLEAAGPSLRIVANYAVGYNNVDVAACTRHGVYVTNTPGVLTECTADLTWALLMAVARRVVEGDRLVRAGGFSGWGPQMLLGQEVAGKTLGIVGCGRIGQAVARRARGFSMQILYHQRNPLDSEVESALGARPVDLPELLRSSDFVSLHCPLTPQTRHLIGADQLDLLKPDAILINTARGPVVDEKALVSFLQDRKLAGAGLDVFEEEPRLAPGLNELDNVVVLPHIGSATVETRRRMGEVAVANIRAALKGAVPPEARNAEDLNS